MRLTHIRVDNFLGARAVDVKLTKRVNLFAGANGSGKSSVRDAVALALTGDFGRVPLKKAAGQLVTEGAGSALISIDHDAMTEPAFISISAAGKVAGKTPALPELLPYVLDAQKFARLPVDERRAFLFGLMGLAIDGPAVCGRLSARGLDMVKAARIAPLLRAGFDAAAKEAKSQATQAKGAWKAVTGGEIYGSEKAKTWQAPLPGAAAEGEPTDPALLKSCEAALETWQREVGKLQAEQARRRDLAEKLPALQEAAGRLARAQTKLSTDEAELISRAEELERTRAAAGTGPRVGLVHELGWALHNMVMFGDSLNPSDPTDARVLAALEAYEREHGKVSVTGGGDPEAAARLPAVQQAHQLMARAVVNDQRDIDAAKRAQVEADTITAELAPPFDGAAIAAAQAEVAKLKAEQVAIRDRLNLAASAKRAAEAARQRTVDAAQHHADVQAWDAIGDALSPAGIPAEMLAEALGPMNDALAGHAVSAEWPRVGIDADMSITADGRAYGLLSESEKWRCDAMLAAAVAQLSGVRMLVLDRFDVLDLQGRGDLIAWLDILASDGDIDTALIFGTLKALPAQLPTTIAAHWLDNGVCGQLKEAA